MAEFNYYNGDADKILNHAKNYCITKAERIEYLETVFAIHQVTGGALIDPLTEIQSEIRRLRGPQKDEREKKKRKEQGPNFNWLRPFDKDLDKIFQCANLRRSISVSGNTFLKWHSPSYGIKICDKYNLMDWLGMKYETAPKTKNLRLKLIANNRSVLKRDLIEFLKFTGLIELI